ncbi:(4Fe-4S)-binding protein [Kurthia sibirica]|uniref:Divergent 4Fe-4S mono-cluster domain-containing protein n=1 Tax=Kurthia sibirica TaxID=202750 RepID=A0A2U3AQ99_9BACL|nr:(4Fe-4S)-binding protein [Kurthia sibirica]PWI26721.1 hypothetical protein DEX24_00015 [Kurthia sibirica]GEK32749.1 hypothetical protein KSI01_02820 [Kurthia sibirica]
MNEEKLLANGYRKYVGTSLDVYFNTDLCEHSGVCVKGQPAVFNLQQKPWIKVDAASNQEVTAVVNRCPSGALQYIQR